MNELLLAETAPQIRASRRTTASLIAGGFLVGSIALAALVSYVWTPYDPTVVRPDDSLVGSSWQHLLGADQFGHDTVSQLMVGARTTLWVGVVAIGIAALIGIPLGAIAAQRGGAVDEVAMRASDIVYAFPAVLIAIMLAAAYGRSTTTAMIAIGIAYIPVFARLDARVGAAGAALGLRARGPRVRPPAARDPDAPRAAEHRRDPDRAGDRAVRGRDPRRGRALLPRPRHVAADPDLGRHAHEQPDVPERATPCWRSGRASRSRSPCSASACSATGCATCSIRDCGADERRAAGGARSHGRARRPARSSIASASSSLRASGSG